MLAKFEQNRMVQTRRNFELFDKQLEPNVSPHKQIVKDDDVKECITIEGTGIENQKVSFFSSKSCISL